MDTKKFIDSIRQVVVENSITSVISNLENPPGRKPPEETIRLSKWFNELEENDKAIVVKIIDVSVNAAVFGFLCVLDGVRAIESSEEKGQLMLYYKKENKTVLLNPNDNNLHELI